MELSVAAVVSDVGFGMGDPALFFLTGCPMTVRFETSMVRPRSDVVRRDIRLSGVHPMAVGSDVRVGRFGWVSYILWIAVCYQGRLFRISPYRKTQVGTNNPAEMFEDYKQSHPLQTTPLKLLNCSPSKYLQFVFSLQVFFEKFNFF